MRTVQNTENCTIDTPEAALRWCASASDMETFKSRVLHLVKRSIHFNLLTVVE